MQHLELPWPGWLRTFINTTDNNVSSFCDSFLVFVQPAMLAPPGLAHLDSFKTAFFWFNLSLSEKWPIQSTVKVDYYDLY